MADLAAPPVLSTPDDHILDALEIPTDTITTGLTDDVLPSVYEIDRTVTEILAGKWKRIALQFPDSMLPDAPRVSQILSTELNTKSQEGGEDWGGRVYILADTSYAACCVDEVAAEHADAEVVVHYGRACLSPTSRLPVIYVYTSRALDHNAALEVIEAQFSDKGSKVVMVADLMYQNHVDELVRLLCEKGYTNVLASDVVRDPTGLIPNRRIRLSHDASQSLDDEAELKTYALFHISDPPQALLLALYNRFSGLNVLSIPDSSPSEAKPPTFENLTMRTGALLRRRFASVLSLASSGVIGILVNTLSVTASLSSIDHLRRRIADAGKKSYTVVVGRLNPAKLANFSEVEGWVVVGCWQEGLVQGDGYWRPAVTPFELEVALMSEEERIWGGEWWGGTEKLKLEPELKGETEPAESERKQDDGAPEIHVDGGVEGEESLPPVFDMRTGRLVSHSRPMQLPARSKHATAVPGGQETEANGEQTALIQRSLPGELASVNGVVSPGAEYLRSQRTWQGLGSDFAEGEENAQSTLVEEGRSGIARGYTVGRESRH